MSVSERKLDCGCVCYKFQRPHDHKEFKFENSKLIRRCKDCINVKSVINDLFRKNCTNECNCVKTFNCFKDQTMEFGKYKNMSYEYVYKNDFQYLVYLINNNKTNNFYKGKLEMFLDLIKKNRFIHIDA